MDIQLRCSAQPVMRRKKGLIRTIVFPIACYATLVKNGMKLTSTMPVLVSVIHAIKGPPDTGQANAFSAMIQLIGIVPHNFW